MRTKTDQEKIIEALEGCLSEYPSLRFGQLVSNILSCVSASHVSLFYVEDADFLAAVYKFMRDVKSDDTL